MNHQYLKKIYLYFQFLPVHTSRKTAYTNMYKTQKLINQSIFGSSWVPSLANCMQWEIWLQKCKMDKESNAMHVLIYMCNAWKDWLIKNLKIENFPVSIDRTSIEYRLKEAESFEHKSSHFLSVEGDLRLVKMVKNFKTLKFDNFMQKNNLKRCF